MAKPAIPDTLKKANWDKQKGVVAKIVKGETGIGAALDGVTAAYNAVPWEKVDEKAAASAKSAEEMKKVFAEGKAVLSGPIEAARKKSFELSALAKKVAEGFKKNPLVPKSSREYLEKMADGASVFATMMRDSTIDSLKKLDEEVKEFDTFAVQIKKEGEEYVANRKLALVQMKGLQTLFTETRTRALAQKALAEAAAKRAAAAPSTAGAEVVKVKAIVDESKKMLQAAKDRYRKEGDVNQNPVQQKARGNIGQFMPKPTMSKYLTAYQETSKDVFNQIMGCVAAIMKLEAETNTIISDTETTAEIAEQAATAGTKSIGDHQRYAQAATKSAVETAAKLADNNKKLAECEKRMPKYLENLKAAAGDPKKVAPAMSTAETTIGEIERRQTALEQGLAQVTNFQKRLKSLPGPVQSDAIVKGEIAKIDGVIKQLQAVGQQGAASVQKAQAVWAQMQKIGK